MADEEGQLRTEEPTPRRREDARERGQIAFSSELTAAAVVMAGAAFLLLLGPETGSRLLDAFRGDLAKPVTELDVGEAQAIGGRQMLRLAMTLGAFFGMVVAAAVAAGVAQAGFHVVTSRLAPDFEKLSPSAGLSRFFSVESFKRLGMSLLKAAAIVAVAYVAVRGRAGSIAALGSGTTADAVTIGWEVCLRLVLFLAGTLLALGAIDYFLQWRKLESALRMTKQEMKEEAKREEGDPAVKARLRVLQRQRSQQRTLAAVPRATVVITNPTHYAVALRYDRNADKAPVVIAKGAGVMARQIAERARRHAVPVLERPPLARALYSGVREGQEIPPELFRAVAEVVAFVFRLRAA